MLGALQFQRVRRVAPIAVLGAAALAGALAAPAARAASNGPFGVGFEYAAPVRYFQITGTNQRGEAKQTPVESVAQSSSAPPYQWVWLVSPSELVSGPNPPAVAADV